LKHSGCPAPFTHDGKFIQRSREQARERLIEIKTGINEGEITFGDAAAQHSEDASALKQGDLGTFGPGESGME